MEIKEKKISIDGDKKRLLKEVLSASHVNDSANKAVFSRLLERLPTDAIKDLLERFYARKDAIRNPAGYLCSSLKSAIETSSSRNGDSEPDPEYVPVTVPFWIIDFLRETYCEDRACDALNCDLFDEYYGCRECEHSPCRKCRRLRTCQARIWGRMCPCDREKECQAFGKRGRCALENLMDKGIIPKMDPIWKNDRGFYSYFSEKHHPRTFEDFPRWYLACIEEGMLPMDCQTGKPQPFSELLEITPPFAEKFIAKGDLIHWKAPGCRIIGDALSYYRDELRAWKESRDGAARDWHLDGNGRPFLSMRMRDAITEVLEERLLSDRSNPRQKLFWSVPPWFFDDSRYFDDRTASA